MSDNKSFFRLIVERLGLKQNRVAVILGWSPQRVGYLCSSKCKGFPFEELGHIKEHLGIEDSAMVKIQNEYFASKGN